MSDPCYSPCSARQFGECSRYLAWWFGITAELALRADHKHYGGAEQRTMRRAPLHYIKRSSCATACWRD
jgi:hypothetical protein